MMLLLLTIALKADRLVLGLVRSARPHGRPMNDRQVSGATVKRRPTVRGGLQTAETKKFRALLCPLQPGLRDDRRRTPTAERRLPRQNRGAVNRTTAQGMSVVVGSGRKNAARTDAKSVWGYGPGVTSTR
jgi:hypothetical protein